MRVFVTGGTGFIGSHIVKVLAERGDRVTVLSRRPTEFPWPTDVVVADLDDPKLDRAMAGHDAVVHCALVWGDEEQEREMKDVACTKALYKSADRAGIGQFIYTSSVAVHRPFTAGMTEESRMTPNDLYGQTKLQGEGVLRGGPRPVVIRPGPTVGAPAFEGGPHKSDRRFVEFVSAARAGDDLVVAEGDGRQFIGVTDLADLYLAVLDSPAAKGAYLGLAPEFVTWEAIAGLTVEALGSSSRVRVEGAGGDHGMFDLTKIEREFGFRFDASDSLRDHIKTLALCQTG